jgi:hypothetical protein
MKLINFIALATLPSSSAFSGAPRAASVTTRVSSLNLSDRRCDDSMDLPTRRSWLVGAATFCTGFLTSPDRVMAFSNKISSQYDDRPKQRGSKVGLSSSSAARLACL